MVVTGHTFHIHAACALHDGMQRVIIVELVHGVLIFTFEGGFVAFWCGAKGVVIIFHTRSTSHNHKLVISLATHRIAPAPSVSPPQTLPPTPLDPTVVLFLQEPPRDLLVLCLRNPLRDKTVSYLS